MEYLAMPELENSKSLELTKEEQDDLYKAIIMLQELEGDLQNIKLTMESGKFFNAMDHVIEAMNKPLIGQEAIRSFVKTLGNKKIWVQKNA